MHGVLLVDKPEGISSAQAVGVVKKFVRPSKVGHTGTLDPAASGLLVLLIGVGTRALDYLNETRKKYSMRVKLGEETDTCDREGVIVSQGDPSDLTLDRIEDVLRNYRGVIDQAPPQYSAIKKNGVPLYKLARKGVEVEVPLRKVEVFSLTVTGWETPWLDLDLVCSKGTYARALARDIGRDLGVGGRLEQLTRTESGAFKLEDAVPLDEISFGGADLIRERLLSLSVALAHIPDLQVMMHELKRLMRGSPIRAPQSRLPSISATDGARQGLLKAASPDGSLIVLVRPQPTQTGVQLQPIKVFQAYEWD